LWALAVSHCGVSRAQQAEILIQASVADHSRMVEMLVGHGFRSSDRWARPPVVPGAVFTAGGTVAVQLGGRGGDGGTLTAGPSGPVPDVRWKAAAVTEGAVTVILVSPWSAVDLGEMVPGNATQWRAGLDLEHTSGGLLWGRMELACLAARPTKPAAIPVQGAGRHSVSARSGVGGLLSRFIRQR